MRVNTLGSILGRSFAPLCFLRAPRPTAPWVEKPLSPRTTDQPSIMEVHGPWRPPPLS